MRFLLVFIGVVLLLNCSIKSPEFTITGQKTALEQQVLGSYQQLADNAIVTTSARTSAEGSKQGGQQQIILQAMQSQKFNKDEIEELKRDQVIGENNRGYLEVRPTSKYEQDGQYKKLVDELVSEENGDRRIIYERVLVMSQLSPEEETRTNSIFADMQFEQSPAGTLIQQPSGEWIEKPKDKK